MKNLLTILVVTLFASSAMAGQVVLEQTDLPYAVSTGDTITFSDPNDTIYVGSGTLFSFDSKSYYYNILLMNQVTNVDVDFGNTVIYFDTAATTTPSDRAIGIFIRGGDGSHFRGGHIISDEGDGVDVSEKKIGINTYGLNDVTFDSVGVTVDGHDAICVFNEQSGVNNVFHGGTWTNNSTSYSSRESFAGGSIAIYFGQVQETPAAGKYNLELHNVTVARTPHAGIYMNEARVFVENCNIEVDAQNVYWDTTTNNIYWYPYDGGTYKFMDSSNCPDTLGVNCDSITDCFSKGICPVGKSSTNCYGIFVSRIYAGSKILNNHITSSPDHQGGRGMSLENCTGTETDSIIVSGNYIETHYGPNGESPFGETRVFRLRSIDGGHSDYIAVRNNTFIGIADTSSATTAVGRTAAVLHFNLLPNDVGYGHVSIENNTVIGRALTEGTDTRAMNASIYQSFTSEAQVPVTIQNNHYISSSIIVRGSDIENGLPIKFITFYQDTLQFIDTTSDSGIVHDPVTWSMGYYNSDSPDNVGRDCIYTNGATDTNIVFSGTGEAELALQSTLEILVRSNGSPLSGATVTVWNNLADTSVAADTSFLATSGVDGIASGIFQYWYESNTATDTTNYNPALIQVVYNGKTIFDTLEVSWDTKADTVNFETEAAIIKKMRFKK